VTVNATEVIAAFAAETRLQEIPSDVQRLSKRQVLDTLGLMLAGSTTEGCHLTHALFEQLGGAPQATAIGTRRRFSVVQAAYANGEAAHAMDYDDTQLAASPDRVYGLLMHPAAPILGAVLPVAEWMHASGAQLLLALAIGVEVSCKVAEALDPSHYRNGFHTTGTVGALGAAIGAGRLLGLDARRLNVALGLSASMAAGLRENFGTMTKPLDAGRAAENGVLAALRVARGHTASRGILEAPRGFFAAYGGGHWAVIQTTLGAPWTAADPGISIKPYPSGSLTHPAVDATLELVLEHDLRPADVDQIHVAVNQYMPQALLHDTPHDELQAKFSMKYGVAIALLDRRAGITQFSDARVKSEDARAWVRRVVVEVDERANSAGYDRMYSIVSIRLKDGRIHERQASYAKGSPHKPMTDHELAAKFRECVALVEATDAEAQRVIEQAGHLELVADVADLAVLEWGGPAADSGFPHPPRPRMTVAAEASVPPMPCTRPS
jgi:2-methylcitrate dehydratase PrpD